MERQRIIKYLTHPLFIGLVLTLLPLLIWFPDFSRFRVRQVEKLLTPGVTKIYFSDLDHDGNSEEINIDVVPTLLKIMLLKEKNVISQHNLRSRPLANEFFYTGDYDNDRLSEIYLLTLRNDSVLLSILDPLNKDDFILTERLIFHNDSVHYEVDIPQGAFSGLVDFRDGRGRTLVFSISTGFSKRPRAVYRYDIIRDELMESPLSGVSIHQTTIGDINSDSVPEIMLNTMATGNYPAAFPYSDSSTWLMVLDGALRFIFEPVEFTGYPATIFLTTIPSQPSADLVVLHHTYGENTPPPAIYLYSDRGELIRSRPVDRIQRGHYYIARVEGKNGPGISLMDTEQGTITLFDHQLEVIATRDVFPLFRAKPAAVFDINLDHREEYIFNGTRNGTFVIYTHDLRNPLQVDFEERNYPDYFVPVVREGEGLFYAQYTDAGYLSAYEKNPLYYLRIPFFILIYSLVSAIVYMVYRIQKYRADMRYLTQKKISELQILSLKNQIDPHFTFNVVNALGSLYARENNRERAYDLFVKYSRLLRHALQYSDQISVSLSEELDFIRNYLELEQSRCEVPFTYHIESSDEVNLSRHIPRMLIHSFAENAIKHGLSLRKSGGDLRITLTRSKAAIIISVRDNGPGLEGSHAPAVESTGKGLQIVDELISLFNKLEGTRISYSLRDLRNEAGQTGMEATVTIPD